MIPVDPNATLPAPGMPAMTSHGGSAVEPSSGEAGLAKVLVVDIGGTKLKLLVAGEHEPRKTNSGRKLTPAAMIEAVKELAGDWRYDVISIGYPGLVGDHGPRCEPGNLGSGWVGFDYAAAFGMPVRIINDAAMQALGSYEGGRMLFLGLGTGMGSALIAENVVVTLELGNLVGIDGQPLGITLGKPGMTRLGKREWRKAVNATIGNLLSSLIADYVVVGGGSAKELKELPHGARLGHNLCAFRGGFRLWSLDDVHTQSNASKLPYRAAPCDTWRLI